jgi:hypothetical protein
MYILCLYKKDLLRGDFGALQSCYEGVISKIGIACWSQVYVYILSMGKGVVRVEHTSSFFCADHAPSMDCNWRGSSPQPDRYRDAIKRYRSAINRLLEFLSRSPEKRKGGLTSTILTPSFDPLS